LIGFSIDTHEAARWQVDRDEFVAAVEAMGAKAIVSSANSDDSTTGKGRIAKML